ncbi:hypothetical protein ACWED2_24440 [Amycolatopsis sp. NPDC005003]
MTELAGLADVPRSTVHAYVSGLSEETGHALIRADSLLAMAAVEIGRGESEAARAHAEQARVLHGQAGCRLGVERADAVLTSLPSGRRRRFGGSQPWGGGDAEPPWPAPRNASKRTCWTPKIHRAGTADLCSGDGDGCYGDYPICDIEYAWGSTHVKA